jgi:ABC-2 type transport system ATP-binding protein
VIASGYAARRMSEVIGIRGLEKSYGKHMALSGLDLSVGSGEVYGFLGRNGAGKSTTIRILMGITRPTKGEVRLFGERFDRDVVRLRQRIGYVAQEQSFYGWMNAAQMGRFVRGFFPTWDEGEWSRVVRVLDVPLDRRIDGFSGGMRVKLALALALAHRPPLLLLDEPTAGLDPVARREFLDIVRAEASGRTTFFSTHLIDEIELVAQRVGVVDGGRTKFEGTVVALGDRVRLFETRMTKSETAESARALWQPLLAGHGVRIAHAEARSGTLRMMLECADPTRFDAVEGDETYRRAEGPPLTVVPLEEAFIAMVRRS